MNILFVCHANVGRSQVAQVYFDKLSRHISDSAGIAVDELIAKHHLRGRKLKDVTNRAAEYIRECIRNACGVDIAEKERQQLTPAIVDAADLIVVIAEKAPSCGVSLHVRDLPLYDYREALRPPTRFLPIEEEEYEEEG